MLTGHVLEFVYIYHACFSYNNLYYTWRIRSAARISIEPSCRYRSQESVYNRCAQKGCHLYSRLETHMSITEHPTHMKNEREGLEARAGIRDDKKRKKKNNEKRKWDESESV